MKIYKFIVLICLFVGIQTFAQSTQIEGLWKFNYQCSYNILPQAKKVITDNLGEEVINALKERYKDCQISLNGDGSYTQILEFGKTGSGNWSHTSGDGILVLINSSGSRQEYQIHQLTANQLHISVLLRDSEDHIIPTEVWCYTR